ncbi:TRAP transporter small permease [Acetobacteraceae bacterium H6797]|nr:TRAP transporter small permease [Acetobacteraceae bacterium H6797]
MVMLRRALNALYLAGGIAGAFCLAAVAVIIVVQIAGRETGREVPGADDLTAFAVAASALLPLAYSFRHGAHIRVDLIIGHVRGRARFVMEALALVVAAALCIVFAYAMLDLGTDSLEFDDVSQGSVAWKLWWPQLACGLGVAVFAISLIDDLVVHLAGGTPSYRVAAEKSALERAAEEV